MDLLHDDAIKTVGEYAGKLYGASAYICFAQTCRRTKQLLLQPHLDGRDNQSIRTVIRFRSHPKNNISVPRSGSDRDNDDDYYAIRSLEQLAIFEEWTADCTDFVLDNRIVFPYASSEIEPHMRARILEIAAVVERRSSASVRLDSHCGTVAPSGISSWFSRARGLSVRNAICDDQGGNGNSGEQRGRRQRRPVDRGRVAVVGWGKRIAKVVARSDHPFRVVAGEGRGWVEVYLEVPGPRDTDEAMILPPRHGYYHGVGSSSDSALSDSDEEGSLAEEETE